MKIALVLIQQTLNIAIKTTLPILLLLNTFLAAPKKLISLLSTLNNAVVHFQFFGSGKFAKVNSIRSKGMKNAIKLRAWTVKDEIFIGLLSTETADHNTLEIFRAVKSGKPILVLLWIKS